MVTTPTRGQNILDLFLTTNPTLVNKTHTIPGISDHDAIVCIDINIKAQTLKQTPWKIPLYKKADWTQLGQTMKDYYED